MSDTPHLLPERPNLRHLKDQAKDLLRSGAAASTTDAQFQIARRYGFASWAKLKAHVEELVAADALQLAAQTEVGQLKRAIDTEDFDRVASMTLMVGLVDAPSVTRQVTRSRSIWARAHIATASSSFRERWTIGKQIRSASQDVLKVETGSLYPALHRLEAQGWIASEWQLSDKGKRAKYYRLTRTGRKQLLSERDRWERRWQWRECWVWGRHRCDPYFSDCDRW